MMCGLWVLTTMLYRLYEPNADRALEWQRMEHGHRPKSRYIQLPQRSNRRIGQ